MPYIHRKEPLGIPIRAKIAAPSDRRPSDPTEGAIMKINNDVAGAIRHDPAPTKATDTPSAKPTTAVAHADRVHISEAGRSLHTDGSEAPFDSKRVDAIKAAISSGTFKVNADAVASKLIDSVNQLLTDKS